MIDIGLLQKYNIPVPRYTSYPTVPFWNEKIDAGEWKAAFVTCFEKNGKESISLYIHLPFCESLCTYCGCNKKITTNHAVEDEYIDAVLKEWQLYIDSIEEKPVVKELHLGGGTPTFFSPRNLERLLDGIFRNAVRHENAAHSFEGHPNNTTAQHLQTLYDLGFRRVSFGVQDNDAAVQRVINRIQPFSNVQRVTETARAIGYTSVNFDLIYGLPLQRLSGIEQTIKECLSLRPDRVAFYSYAHVPWTSRGQRLFDEHNLPSASEKLQLYILGRELFNDAGYQDIGMDHFALPGDELHTAWKDGSLHRNFMGYTTQTTSMMLGLGVSAISDTGNAFGQNVKTIQDYYRLLNDGQLPVQKGMFLNDEDLVFKKYILDLSCRGETTFVDAYYDVVKDLIFPRLALLEADGFITYTDRQIKLTPLGRQFTRIICSAFDLYLLRNTQKNESRLFSKAV